MGGKANTQKVIEARRKKVDEYLGIGFMHSTIAEMLGVSVVTIDRDAVVFYEGVREQKERMRKHFVEQRIAGHQQRMNILSDLLTKAREANPVDEARVQSILKSMKEEEDTFVDWMQDFGEATKVASQMEVKQTVITDPLAGLFDNGSDGKTTADSNSQDKP